MKENEPDRVQKKLPNSELKSIKVSPELHKAIRLESVRAGEQIPETVERAWRAYESSSGAMASDNPAPLRVSDVREVPDELPAITAVSQLSDTEREAQAFMLYILRHGADTHRQALMWNLRGWAESAKEHHERTPPSTIAEAIDGLAESTQQLADDEGTRQRWLDELQRLKGTFGKVSPAPRKARGNDRQGRKRPA